MHTGAYPPSFPADSGGTIMRSDTAMTPTTRFILVGHCGPDNAMLSTAVRRAVPGATVEIAATERDLDHPGDPSTVLLINRVLDGEFRDESGLAMIEHFAREPETVRPVLILISDMPEWQTRATALGAHRGFGKSKIYAEETADLLRTCAAKASEQRSAST